MKTTKSQFFSTRGEIAKWLKKYHIENYTINDDLSVDVDGNVYFSDKYIKSIPVKFRKVDGNFWCGDNQLITLIGSPKIVKGGFYCSGNQLRSLACSPKIVEGDFWCQNNKLINLTGAPKAVGGSFYCFANQLINLIGAPESVALDFWCHNNKIINLTGVPKAVKGNLVCFGNPLISLFELNACAFNGYVNFNIDENKIKQKNLVKMLKKYHRKNCFCMLFMIKFALYYIKRYLLKREIIYVFIFKKIFV